MSSKFLKNGHFFEKFSVNLFLNLFSSFINTKKVVSNDCLGIFDIAKKLKK